jgi:hypothetical protein
VAERIDDAAGAIAVELVRDRPLDGRACCFNDAAQDYVGVFGEWFGDLNERWAMLKWPRTGFRFATPLPGCECRCGGGLSGIRQGALGARAAERPSRRARTRRMGHSARAFEPHSSGDGLSSRPARLERRFSEAPQMKKRKKYIHEGKYVAEVEVELIETEDEWSPYLSVEEACKLDHVRQLLRTGQIEAAAEEASVYEMTPVASSR